MYCLYLYPETSLSLQQWFHSHIISIDSMFPSYTRLTVDEAYNKLLYNGNKLPLEAVVNEDCEFLDMEKFRIYDSGNTFVGIYQYIAGQFVLEKMFYEG